MKIVLSILLSLTLALMGVPTSVQTKAGENSLTKYLTEQKETHLPQKETTTQQIEEIKPGSLAYEDKNNLPEDKSSFGKTEENTEEKAEETDQNKTKQKNKRTTDKDQKETEQKERKKGKTNEREHKKGEDRKKKKSDTGKAESAEETKTRDGRMLQEQLNQAGAEILESETPERAASAELEDLLQNTDNRILELRSNETLENTGKTGYTTQISRKISCKHTAGKINGSIKCTVAQKPLNPTKEELKKNIVLTGSLKGKSVTKSVQNYDAGGKENTVAHRRLKVTIKDEPEIEAEYLASPYVCPDGNAGYAYFEFHYSYCPNTEQFYKVQESHVWLGCTRGDGGFQEFKPLKLSHTFDVYKFVPINYKVAYDANGGTGNVSGQSAVYDTDLILREGRNYKRPGYTLTGWNTKKNGTGKAYKLLETVTNLTAVSGEEVILYAQWTPNVLTIKYNANQGVSSDNAKFQIETFFRNWNYGGTEQDPVDVSSFGLSRPGYSVKDGAEWNTSSDGTGVSFDQAKSYAMTAYAPELVHGNWTVTLYANWQPDVYTVTLDNQLNDPEVSGTGKIYKKYRTGLYFDENCTEKTDEHKIVQPRKDGYIFQGYFSEKTKGTKMADASGQLTEEGREQRNSIGNETWYAQYAYSVKCEDYADIPCDLKKTDADNREEPGVCLTYNRSGKTVIVETAQKECSVSLTGMKAGTCIGNFQSSLSAGSASGNTGGAQTAELYFTVLENTAYQLKVVKNGVTVCERPVYYKDGRFRTLVKLGNLEAKTAVHGGSLAGSDWNMDKAGYGLYQYESCSELHDIQEPGTVQRYFRYKNVNMAYSGNGATAGANMLECDVSLEQFYQFRENGFTRTEIEKKRTEQGKEYECEVTYSFQGWEMNMENTYSEKQQKYAYELYDKAHQKGGVSDRTIEDIRTYQITEPDRSILGTDVINLDEAARRTEGTFKEPFINGEVHAVEYINFQAKWDAFPTIVADPEKKLEFFEGEKVTKEKIIGHLIAHDKEDNEGAGKSPNLNDKLRIIKISYPQSSNGSQTAYEKRYKTDVPEDFLLDTYYLKLEKDETVDVLVTFAVTDSKGNTTEKEFPLRVKYNNYPEIDSDDVFYYMKEEANAGTITAEVLTGRASAEDEEDGDLSSKLELKNFDPQKFKLQTESKAEFDITYQVTDSYMKTTYKTVKVMVWDDLAVTAETPRYYVRFISEKYLDTLEEHSVWRKPQNFTYLKRILNNKTPMETWSFTNEDVRAVQKWITQGEEGTWKIGQGANREFLTKFGYCRQ